MRRLVGQGSHAAAASTRKPSHRGRSLNHNAKTAASNRQRGGPPSAIGSRERSPVVDVLPAAIWWDVFGHNPHAKSSTG